MKPDKRKIKMSLLMLLFAIVLGIGFGLMWNFLDLGTMSFVETAITGAVIGYVCVYLYQRLVDRESA